MSRARRTIEVDAETAKALEAEAAARGISVADLVADFAHAAGTQLPPDLASMRAAGRGPWSPAVLAEDARRMAEFERTGEGVPWDEVKAWVESWGTDNELPVPRPRKL